jgi:hypothetical protein
LTKEDDELWFQITDTGIGMSAGHVAEYFLTVGGTFRQTKEFYSTRNSDIRSGATCLAGRFGIGALAAFLLGDEFQVSTRYFQEKLGVSLNCSMNSEFIQLKKKETEIGTTIRIRLRSEVHRFFKSHGENESLDRTLVWYEEKWPDIKCTVPQNWTVSKVIPNDSKRAYFFWHELSVSPPLQVRWSWNAKNDTYNGIQVREANSEPFLVVRNRPPNLAILNKAMWIQRPTIELVDPEAKIPINLQRTKIETSQLEFHESLTQDVVEDFFAYLLVHTPKADPFQVGQPMIDYPGMQATGGLFSYFWCSRDGLSLVDHWHANLEKPSQIFVCQTFSPGEKLIASQLDKSAGYLVNKKHTLNVIGSPMGMTFMRLEEVAQNARDYLGLPVVGMESLIFKQTERGPISLSEILDRAKNQILDSNGGQLPNRFFSSRVIAEDDQWAAVLTGDIHTTQIRWEDCLGPLFEECQRLAFKPDGYFVLRMDYRNHNFVTEPTSLIANMWQEIIQKPYIPYSPETRRRELSYAYGHLGQKIKAWEISPKSAIDL